MDLRPQDVVVALKLLAGNTDAGSYSKLGEQLAMSASHVFASVNRAQAAHLLDAASYRFAFGMPSGADWKSRGRFPHPNRNNLKEFLIHGVKYAFPVERGGPTRGIPTAEAAHPLDRHFPQDFPLPPVWPYADGSVRGIAFSPLYKNVPQAALKDPKLYELLPLLDAIHE